MEKYFIFSLLFHSSSKQFADIFTGGTIAETKQRKASARVIIKKSGLTAAVAAV
jgi:hypothetical protein